MMENNIIESAVKWAIDIANDDAHGYDQANRWGPDYDCSSLVISAFKNAGVPLSCTYTGNMKADLLKNNFIEVDISKRQRGDILLNEKHHCALMISSTELVHASINEQGRTVGGKRGDQTKKEICIRPYYRYSGGWDCCLRYVGNSPAQPIMYYVTSNTGLNIRKEPNIKAVIVGTLNWGQPIEVISISDGWAKISNGFCCAEYITRCK